MKTKLPSRFSQTFLRLFSGPLIWATHFLVVYGFTGVMCARPGLQKEWLGGNVTAWGIVGLSVIAVCAIAWIHWRGQHKHSAEREAGFVSCTAAGLALLSVVAILWETLPVFMLPPCG